MSLRLWVSDLDTFDYWRRSGGGGDRLKRMLAERPPSTPQQRAGIAFHDAVEYLQDLDEGDTVHVLEGRDDDGIKHSFRVRPHALSLCVTSREVRQCITLANGIIVKGRVDGIIYGLDGKPTVIVDYKSTFRAPNFERLERSWQWRAYLAASGASIFRYEVAYLAKDRAPCRYTVRSWSTMYQYPYPGMLRDIENHAEEVRSAAKTINWEGRR